MNHVGVVLTTTARVVLLDVPRRQHRRIVGGRGRLGNDAVEIFDGDGLNTLPREHVAVARNLVLGKDICGPGLSERNDL